MAITLPITAGAKTAAPGVAPAAPPFGAHAPSSTLPLMFTVTGLLALFTSAGWLLLHPEILAAYHYSPAAVAVTHLFVLGWLASVVMGAMYQLVPVALETKLYSERLAQFQFACHAAGFTGMVWAFHFWNLQHVVWFGSVMVLGVALFVFNIARTLVRVPKWNVVATAVASAVGWVLLAVVAGLVIATAKSFSNTLPAVSQWVFRFDPLGAMHAHAHLGAIGFFTVLMVGVSCKLVPMFTLSELQNRRRAAASIILLNLGLAGTGVAILCRSPWRLAFAWIIVGALVLYALELRAILRARRRRALDWGIRYFLTAVGLMLPLAILAVVLSWPGLPANRYTLQLENVYGLLGLLGVVTFAVIGMLYKIIPFLVWFGTYSRHIGRAQVPALADMYSARWQAIGYWLFLVGLLATLVATECSSAAGVRWAFAGLTASLVVFGGNVARMLRHLVRPQLKPLVKTASPRPAL